jgi:hypothetical protein
VRARLFVLLAVASAAACAPKTYVRPSGPRAPLPDPFGMLDQATAACRSVRTITAELQLSGRAGRQKIRGRALVGAADPASVRLEGVAPFGPPAFILVARGGRGTLLLPRDHRVIRDAPPEAILDALTGVSLAPDALRGLLAGCYVPPRAPEGGDAYGTRWAHLSFGPAGESYLRRDEPAWHLVATTTSALHVEYDEFSGAHPRKIRLRTTTAGQATTELTIALSQVEMNVAVEAAAFEVKIPDDAEPLSLEELRAAGPLGARDR